MPASGHLPAVNQDHAHAPSLRARHRLLQRHRPRRRKNARRPGLHRHRFRPQGRGCGPAAAAGSVGGATGSGGQRQHRARGGRGAGPGRRAPLRPLQQRRLRPARCAGRSAHRGAARAVRDQPLWLASPHSPDIAPHAGGRRGAHRAEQLGAWPGGHEVSWRLQRQQVRAGRLYRHPAPGTRGQRRAHQPDRTRPHRHPVSRQCPGGLPAPHRPRHQPPSGRLCPDAGQAGA